MFNSVFERITYLEYQLQAKKALIDAFESGDKYVQMQEEYRNNLRHLERRIKNLEAICIMFSDISMYIAHAI